MDTIQEMLKENTGRHMLDSGGAYGRNFEKNSTRDFASEPALKVDFSFDMEVTLNLYHFLTERLEYRPDIQANFDKFAELPDQKDEAWLTIMENFAMIPLKAYMLTVNSYNEDSLLDQVIQYVEFEDDDGAVLVLLQVHGGCDLRGGYSSPRVFEADDLYSLGDNAQASVQCKNNTEHHWDTDDGCHWLLDGTSCEKELQDYETTDSDDFSVEFATQALTDGNIYVDRDGVGYCPICGGQLH